MHRIGLGVLDIPFQQPIWKRLIIFSDNNHFLLTAMSLLSSPISAPSLTRETKSASFLADNSSTCAYNSF